MSAEPSPLEKLLRRDRVIVAVALLIVTALCWWYLVDMALAMGAPVAVVPDAGPAEMPASMEGSATKSDDEEMSAAMEGSGSKSGGDEMSASMEGSGSKQDASASGVGIFSWTPRYFWMMFVMWAVMMIGMMIPSAAPMILIYARAVRQRNQATPHLLTGLFVSGYLIAWTAFSLGATILQWVLDEAALLSPMMVSTSPLLGAGLLIAAGIYQVTPWKDACLAHCRTPMQFFMQHWQSGRRGALRMGLHHGWYCLGCCWALMGLLFFGGVMNLVWIGAITVFVLLEKVLPWGRVGAHITAALMVLCGAAVIATGWAG